MVDPGRVFMEAAVLLIEVRQGDTATGLELPRETVEQGRHIGDVVEGHAAHDELVGAAQIPSSRRVQGQQADRDPQGLGLLGQRFQHAGRRIGSGDGTHLRCQGQGHQTSAAAEIEGGQFPVQRAPSPQWLPPRPGPAPPAGPRGPRSPRLDQNVRFLTLGLLMAFGLVAPFRPGPVPAPGPQGCRPDPRCPPRSGPDHP